MKLIAENKSKFCDLRLGCGFLDMIIKAWTTKKNKLCFIKIKNYLCTSKISKKCMTANRWEKIFANHISDKGFLSRIYKELSQLNNRQIIQFLNWQRIKTDISPKKIYKWLTILWKRCSTSPIIREMQLKTTMRYHLTDRKSVV